MESKKINQLSTEVAPVPSDLTVIGDPLTGELKKITWLQVASLIGSGASLNLNDVTTNGSTTANSITIGGLSITGLNGVLKATSGVVGTYPYGGANGVATLDAAGKVPVSQLPSSIMEYKGTWNATTNTPTLANGIGDNGDVYRVSVGGTINLGSGNITFDVGDYVIYNGTIWEKSDTTDAVGSVFGRTGNVVAQEGDYSLTQLSDVTITTPAANNYLSYNGTSWINQAFPSFLSSDKLIVPVRNNSGATITKGTVVYINGAVGNKPTIAKALATTDATSAQTLGLVQDDIINNAEGYVVTIGECFNIDTSAFTEGTQLYLSPTTAGTYTSTKQYAPNHLVYVGIVVRSHPTLGVILVRPMNGFEMDELHNVSAQTPANNHGLFYNTTTSLWESKTIATALGFTPISLTSLSATTPLQYNNTTGAFSILQSSTTQSGFLSNTDWNTFNNKLTSPMSALGDLIYGGASGVATRLAGNITATKNFLSQTGNGTISAAPVWSAVTKADVGLSLVENTALSTWAGSTNLTTLGTITSGTWNATTIAIARGGTGLTALGTGLQLLRVNAGATSLEYFTHSFISLTSLSATSPLSYNNTSGAFSIQQATTTQNGFLSSTDWNTFNGKQSTITLTTTGSSGASTFATNTLNIPNYTLAGLGGQPLNANLTSLSGLTFVSSSLVRMTAANTFALDTNTYLTANQTITLSGNVTGSGTTAITTTISNNVVTNAMLSQVSTATFKGRVTAATGNVEDLTATQATSLLNVFTSTLKGLAPASGGGTTTFLRADGTWATPTGTGFTNPMNTLGDTLYADTGGTALRLAGNITTAKQYLSQTGTGTASAAPSWSSIAGADITGAALTETDDTNVTMTLGGTPATALLRSVSMTLGWTGQLAVGRGGSGASTLTGILVGNGTSAFTGVTGTASQLLRRNAGNTAYEFFSGGNLTKTDDTNVTLTLGGTPTGSLINAVSLTMGWTGQLSVSRGGTGASTLTGVLIGNGTSAFTGVTGTANQLLRRNAGNTAYEFFTFNGLTGTGTTGAITKWTTGGSVLGDSIMFENANGVGVGIANPQAKFSVSNGGVETIELGYSATISSTYIEAINRSTGAITKLSLYTGGNSPVAIYTNATERVHVTGIGDVGIGVVPTKKFQVAPASQYTGINTGDGFVIRNPLVSAANLFFGVDGSGGSPSQGALIQGRDGDSLSYQIQLQPFGGNVGIGINPAHKLDVNGAIGLSGTLFAVKSGAYNVIYDGGGSATLTLGDATQNVNAYDNNTHAFRNRGGSVGYATINSTGLGVGAAPAHKLDVYGNIGLSGVLAIGRIGDYTYLYDGDANSPLALGDSTQPANVYSNTEHYFYNRNQTISFVRMNTTEFHVYNKIVAGTGSATNGTILLQDEYSNGHITNFGTSYSSGAPVIGYCVTPSTSAADTFVSATGLNPAARGAVVVTDALKFFSAGATNTPIGNALTMNRLFEVKINGQLQLPFYTSSGSFSGTAAGYLAFDSSGNIITTTGTGGGGGGFTYGYTNVTTTYTETATSGYKIILANTTSGAFTINLPTAVGNTALLVIKKIAGSGTLTIDASGTQTIDGSLTATISVNDTSLSLISNNSNWLII